MSRMQKIRYRVFNGKGVVDQQYYEDAYFLLQKIDRMQDAFARIVALTGGDCELMHKINKMALDGGFEAGAAA